VASPADVRSQALELSREERAKLARELLASLDEPLDDDRDVEAAWLAEIERRIAEVDAGRASPVPWPEARERILARLRKR
jgi:putative addiction module component (TIGR02574 family)